MKGLRLSSLSLDLQKVPSEFEDCPIDSIDLDQKVGHHLSDIRKIFPDFVLQHHYYRLSLKLLKKFTPDEICKLHHSSSICLHKTVDDLFDRIPRYELVRKIMSSNWRWSYKRGTWNEIVDTYNGIRTFRFSDNPDFEVRFDHTRGYNERGFSKYSAQFFDGVFAFLVYYKGEHVLTIGFSTIGKRRLLIQQVQLAKRSGNRWLYKIPNNRLELVIELFRKHFPNHKLFVVDGTKLVDRIIADYKNGRQTADREERKIYQEKIEHLENDRGRLVAFYSDLGRFGRGKTTYTSQNLTHHRIVSSRQAKKCIRNSNDHLATAG